MKRVVKQLCSHRHVPAAEEPRSRHANLQAQSQGMIKSLLLAILTDVHFSQDLPLDSPKIFHMQFTLTLQPQRSKDKIIQSIPILWNPGTASHLRLSSFRDPGVCQSVWVHWVPENEPTTATKKLSQFKLLSSEVHGFLQLPLLPLQPVSFTIIPQLLWPLCSRSFSCMHMLQLGHFGWIETMKTIKTTP